MIASFGNTARAKALKRLYERGQAKGLNPQWLPRIRLILARLDASSMPEDMDLPGFRLHPLKGQFKGYWSVDVTGNWRIIFRFDGDEPSDVDMLDPH